MPNQWASLLKLTLFVISSLIALVFGSYSLPPREEQVSLASSKFFVAFEILQLKEKMQFLNFDLTRKWVKKILIFYFCNHVGKPNFLCLIKKENKSEISQKLPKIFYEIQWILKIYEKARKIEIPIMNFWTSSLKNLITFEKCLGYKVKVDQRIFF